MHIYTGIRKRRRNLRKGNLLKQKKVKRHGGRGAHLRGGFFPVEESDKIC